MWSNADEVAAFLDRHPPGTNFEVGDWFLLPDVGQMYTVQAVRPFKTSKGVAIYLEFESVCAVEGCECEFLLTKTVRELRKSPYLTRTCPEHRLGWKTPMDGAWKTGEQRAAEAAALESAKQERAERAKPRVGSVEATVLEALEELRLISDEVWASKLVGHAVGKMQPKGQRDTRRQMAARALGNLVSKGVLSLEQMRVRPAT